MPRSATGTSADALRRRRPHRRAVPALVALLLFVASCSESADNTAAEDERPTNTTESPTVDPTTAETIPAAPDTEKGDDSTGAEPIESDVQLLAETWNPSIFAVLEEAFANADDYDPSEYSVSYIPSESQAFDDELLKRLEAGTAGDLIACRPYDRSKVLYDAGYLTDVSDLDTPRIPDAAFEAWTADDGTPYCVPVAKASLGYLYNQAIFDELGLEPPATIDELEAILETVYSDGRYVPLALGTVDESRVGTMLFENLGPSFWGGDEGRQRIVDGTTPMAESGLGELFDLMIRWSRYLPDGHEELGREASAELFIVGDAAVVPIGSWMLYSHTFEVDFEVGEFAPPAAAPGERCLVSSSLDLAFGMNSATENPDEARSFLEFLAGEEFGVAYANNVIGLFSVQDPLPTGDNDLNNNVSAWSTECDTALRFTQVGFGEDAGEVLDLTWKLSTELMQGTTTRDEALAELDQALEGARP